MRVYLDNCCYNRPFDEQTQLRVRLETVTLYSSVECLTQRRRETEKISFTQLVKTTTTPIKRRNLLKLCLSAPLRDIYVIYNGVHGK